ncbi:MAG TPA: hypothetical protein VF462_04335 [Micromonosporaceae bacterium]
MRGKLWFIGGMAAGFVLGARAGREKYEELVLRGRKFLDHPTVQEAAGVAQAQANRLYEEGKDRLGQTKLGEKLSTNGSGTTHTLPSSGEALNSSATGSTTKPSSTSGTTSSSTTGRKPGSSSTTL